MRKSTRHNALSAYARAGFRDLTRARDELAAFSERVGVAPDALTEVFGSAADPDTALQRLRELDERHPDLLPERLDDAGWRSLVLLFGASPALGAFFARHPATLIDLLQTGGTVRDADAYRHEMLRAVQAEHADSRGPYAGESFTEIAGANALRVRYRELLAEIMLSDLTSGEAPDGALDRFDEVSQALSDLAGAAFEAALAVARTTLATTGGLGTVIPRSDLDRSQLAVIAMGKCGAEELNVVSDVDVIFVGESRDPENLPVDSALRVCTRLAAEAMRALDGPAGEPPLWQVDPNLRPEGRTGPLVRTLGSHAAYYERWAKTWEFQALLKARPLAGDAELGAEYVAVTQSFVWNSASREDFVGSVQQMRERVTEHIDDDELEVQLKLGPGGLRDIEFSVQLLQLVHGQHDGALRERGTIAALEALVAGGYVARADGQRLGEHYRFLRVLEHRLQLRELRRTALMPTDDLGLQRLAKASGLAKDGAALLERWQAVRNEVRELHLKIFYAPLLSAVAALPGEDLILGSDEAGARLRGIGFRDPEGALRHMAALTKGSSRRATIRRNLMPVLLHRLADGTDPDYGLLAFRRISEVLGDAPWYLSLLRDGIDTADRLTFVLSSSKYAGELLEVHPEGVAWLEKDEQLRPLSAERIRTEMGEAVKRSDGLDDAAERLRNIHRREILRLALGHLVKLTSAEDVSEGLDAVHTELLQGLLSAILADHEFAVPFPFALIGMGRYGGRELGFAGDVDLIAVYEPADGHDAAEQARQAAAIAAKIRNLVSDPRFILDLDFDLRPEGKNGPLARSLEAYRTYYTRWSHTWEAQALLRARFVAGDAALGRAFIALADEIRYPESFGAEAERDVRTMKARVEAERLPFGAEPRRNLKLGPGGLSDVEWLVQLMQLQHAHRLPALRVVSTLPALHAITDAGLLARADAALLEAAWRLASAVRSAIVLSSGKSADDLSTDRGELEGIARILGLPPDHTIELEERWFSATRRACAVFDREFYGTPDDVSAR